jgi:hypothetical protein
MVWAPRQSEFALETRAKEAAWRATTEGCEPLKRPYQSKSTTVRLAITKQRQEKVFPEGVGKYSKIIDVALPGKHTGIPIPYTMGSSGKKPWPWPSFGQE